MALESLPQFKCRKLKEDDSNWECYITLPNSDEKHWFTLREEGSAPNFAIGGKDLHDPNIRGLALALPELLSYTIEENGDWFSNIEGKLIKSDLPRYVAVVHEEGKYIYPPDYNFEEEGFPLPKDWRLR